MEKGVINKEITITFIVFTILFLISGFILFFILTKYLNNINFLINNIEEIRFSIAVAFGGIILPSLVNKANNKIIINSGFLVFSLFIFGFFNIKNGEPNKLFYLLLILLGLVILGYGIYTILKKKGIQFFILFLFLIIVTILIQYIPNIISSFPNGFDDYMQNVFLGVILGLMFNYLEFIYYYLIKKFDIIIIKKS